MSAQQEQGTVTERTPFESGVAWRSGALAGLVATAATGVVISAIDLSLLELAIAGLYGFEGDLVVGWLAHLAHGTLFGVVFAAVLWDPGLHRVGDGLSGTVAAGVVYGLVLAVAGAGILMPIWLSLVGFPAPPSIPFVDLPMLGWHLIYGAVLGAVYASVDL